MAKFYKAPKGYLKTEDVGYSNIEEGATVYLNPWYVDENDSPRRYVVMNMGKTVLLADDKRMYNRGEGYLYSIFDIDYVKPFK